MKIYMNELPILSKGDSGHCTNVPEHRLTHRTQTKLYISDSFGSLRYCVSNLAISNNKHYVVQLEEWQIKVLSLFT